jgi:hypothetical protein
VKNFAKLVLLFSLSFIIIFLVTTGFRFLALRVEWAKILPAKPETSLTLILTAAHWALSLTLFSSILFTFNYAARKSFFAPMAVITIIALSICFTFAASLALDKWEAVPPATTAGIHMGDRGVVLSNSFNRNETAVVLLNGTYEPLGPRVVSVPEQPMLYYESAGANFELPPVPFGDDTPWFLKSVSIDIRLNSEMFQKLYSQGIMSFLVYVSSLVFILCALGYMIRFSAWPLANLFIGILAFRGILACCTFFNTPESQEIMSSFLKGSFPMPYAVPLIFTGVGFLVCLYAVLVYIIRRKVHDEY